ncbi:MAG: hypothetical protein GF308_18975 [Candidatus Heimdallarchaeota archaeon]|nr:hypothetical protein [Candidatus Heimdallarchaeota archaeon]
MLKRIIQELILILVAFTTAIVLRSLLTLLADPPIILVYLIIMGLIIGGLLIIVTLDLTVFHWEASNWILIKLYSFIFTIASFNAGYFVFDIFYDKLKITFSLVPLAGFIIAFCILIFSVGMYLYRNIKYIRRRVEIFEEKDEMELLAISTHRDRNPYRIKKPSIFLIPVLVFMYLGLCIFYLIWFGVSGKFVNQITAGLEQGNGPYTMDIIFLIFNYSWFFFITMQFATMAPKILLESVRDEIESDTDQFTVILRKLLFSARNLKYKVNKKIDEIENSPNPDLNKGELIKFVVKSVDTPKEFIAPFENLINEFGIENYQQSQRGRFVASLVPHRYFQTDVGEYDTKCSFYMNLFLSEYRGSPLGVFEDDKRQYLIQDFVADLNQVGSIIVFPNLFPVYWFDTESIEKRGKGVDEKRFKKNLNLVNEFFKENILEILTLHAKERRSNLGEKNLDKRTKLFAKLIPFDAEIVTIGNSITFTLMTMRSISTIMEKDYLPYVPKEYDYAHWVIKTFFDYCAQKVNYIYPKELFDEPVDMTERLSNRDERNRREVINELQKIKNSSRVEILENLQTIILSISHNKQKVKGLFDLIINREKISCEYPIKDNGDTYLIDSSSRSSTSFSLRPPPKEENDAYSPPPPPEPADELFPPEPLAESSPLKPPPSPESPELDSNEVEDDSDITLDEDLNITFEDLEDVDAVDNDLGLTFDELTEESTTESTEESTTKSSKEEEDPSELEISFDDLEDLEIDDDEEWAKLIDEMDEE